MGIGDKIAGIMVRRVADLQKRDRDGRVQQQLRNRSGTGNSPNPAPEQTPDIPQNDAGALEEADRMLQEIRDMVQAAASERDAAWSQAHGTAGADDWVPTDGPAFPLSSDSIETAVTGTQEPEAQKGGTGVNAASPYKTFAQARALYFQNSSIPAQYPAEGSEAADAETEAGPSAARSGMPDSREGVGTVVNLVI